MTKDELISGYYDKQGKPIKDLLTWVKMHSDKSYMRIGITVFTDKSFVSTVWLGRDHNFFGEGAPIIFESMYFPKEQQAEEWQERYCTEEEARIGHENMVKRVIESFPNLAINL